MLIALKTYCAGCNREMDIMLVLDTTGYITYHHSDELLTFVTSIVRELGIHTGKVHVRFSIIQNMVLYFTQKWCIFLPNVGSK